MVVTGIWPVTGRLSFLLTHTLAMPDSEPRTPVSGHGPHSPPKAMKAGGFSTECPWPGAGLRPAQGNKTGGFSTVPPGAANLSPFDSSAEADRQGCRSLRAASTGRCGILACRLPRVVGAFGDGLFQQLFNPIETFCDALNVFLLRTSDEVRTNRGCQSRD